MPTSSRKKVGHLPGLRTIFSPTSLLGALIPTSFWNPGMLWTWVWRNQVYPKYGLQTISVLGYLSGGPTICTISLDVAREFLSLKGKYEKDADTTFVLRYWGRNLFTENGSEWSRHRRIMNPAFAPETFELVWAEATKLYQEMIQTQGWVSEKDIMISATNEFTSKFALIIIARCGFGEPMLWNTVAEESRMPLSEALRIVSASSIARAVIPRWMYKLPIKRFRDIDAAFTSLDAYMKSLIATRREDLAAERKDSERKDAFRLMLCASEGQGTLSMTDEELAGNTYLMLIAGHETTAKTLDAAIGFLALYEDIQEDIYKEILALISNDGKLVCCFLEAARLFPAGPGINRYVTEPVALKTDKEDGHGGQIILEPGTRVFIDLIGLHCNPKYFPEPEEFRPSRWYGILENDMTMFSFGPRACIGRRFALTESVAFLSSLLRDWKLHIVLNPGETRAQWRARVMKAARSTLTFGVGEVPVRLTRR
ncbi:cytochrome P450 [Mycena leptocephala]|nr:cytochrome P450 [Mycena leptocephala]